MGANVGFGQKHRGLTIFGDHSHASVGVMPKIWVMMMIWENLFLLASSGALVLRDDLT